MTSKAAKLRVCDFECTVEGCSNPQIAKGICHKHYMRVRRSGTLGTPKFDRSWFEKALEKTSKQGDCWVFLGAKGGGGYGVIKNNGKQYGLSRLAFSELVEPLRPGMFVCHRCDNPACWNPDHLFQGTHADNMEDMAAKGRASRASGERKHTSKLKDDDVRKIRQLLRDGLSQRKVAAQFNVTQSCIWNISSGRCWSEIA